MATPTILEHLANLDENQQKISIERSLALEKAFRSTDVDSIYKAQQYLQRLNNPSLAKQPNSMLGSYKSIVMDPQDVSSSMGYYSKPASLSFEMLRAMAKAPIIIAILNTRKDQIADFCVPQVDKYSKGFVFEKINKKDKHDDVTDSEKREIDQLTKFLLDCADDEDKYDLDDFDAFIRKLVDDALAMDQACFEVVYNRGWDPVKFLAVDGATIRLADSVDQVNNIRDDDKKVNGMYPKFVQVYQSRIINEYYPWELCFGVRNPSSSILSNGYGRSELENLITNVTSMLNTDAYNANFFKNGSAPKGALMIKSGGAGINKDKIAELRRDWNATMSGVNGAHRTPVLDADLVEWLDLQKSNREMEFPKYYELLIKVACAVYKISPEEIGFPLQGQGSNSLGSKEGGQQEKQYSQDKGLKPLLRSIEGWINKFIIGPRSNWKWRFKFAGLDTEDSKTEEERLQKAVTLYMTINEVRAVRDLDPLPTGGDIILNPAWAQQNIADQQQQMGQNPFTQDEGDDNNPFAKALQDYWTKEMTTS